MHPLNVKIYQRKKDHYQLQVFYKGKRYRYANALPIGKDFQPNRLPSYQRLEAIQELKRDFELAIAQGWNPSKTIPLNTHSDPTILEAIRKQLASKLNYQYSQPYLRDLSAIAKDFSKYIIGIGLERAPLSQLTSIIIRDYLEQRKVSNRSKRNYKAALSALLKTQMEEYCYPDPFKGIRIPREAEKMHKPFKEVGVVLEQIKRFDRRLHLCCLLTYGCLLRPHREIRLLRWSDINLELGTITLSGEANKSKRNRVIGVPPYVSEALLNFRLKYDLGSSCVYVFQNGDKPYNKDFFKLLWRKFRLSTTLEPGCTLYSFRHSGSIAVYNKTGSLTKLQTAMGHSDMRVSLTYLRGIEVRTLQIHDMPDLG